MLHKIIILCTVLFGFGQEIIAQGRPGNSEAPENIFLDRSYWASKPGIAEIEENIAKGNSIFEANAGGFDAVTFAIFADNPIETIDYLVEKGNSVNKRTHDSRTYIFWAASRGNLELMKYFAAKGAKMDLKDSHGYTVTSFAAATGQENPAIYDFLIEQGADFQNEKDHHGANVLLVAASRMKNLDLLNYFLSKGMDIKTTDDDGNGIFSYAARGGNLEVLKELKDKGISIKANKNTGENAILFASTSRNSSMEVFSYLESLGINPNVKSTEGTTPLHNLARSSSNLEIFKYFISKGVNVNDADKDGNTALLIASERNKPEIVTFLATNSKNLNHSNKEGVTALAKAVQGNNAEVVNFLISKNANASVKDKNGNNLAYYLLQSTRGNIDANFEEKMNILTTAGVDFKSTQVDGKNLFHLAMEKDNVELLEKINSLGVNVNAKDEQGNTPLHYAAMKTNKAEVLEYLISIGADVKAKTDFGETAFDLAGENELLQKQKIDISFLN